MAIPLLEKIDLDDVLVKFSVWSRYHRVAAIWLTLGMTYNAICYLNYVFVTEEVGYRCADDSYNHNTSEAFNISNKENTIAWCRSTVPCSQWIYDNPHSFVAEFQLACQDWKRNLVGSAHSFGYMIGLLIVGPLSDRLGRKTLIIVTGMSCAVVGILKSFINVYWVYVAFEFLEPVLGDPCSPLYMMAVEMVATESRVTFTTICNMGFAIGGILFPLISWLVPYWRTFLRVIYAPGLLFIFLIYLLDESPRWLLTKGKGNAAVKIIEKAAKVNKIELKEDLTLLKHEKDSVDLSFMSVLADTFKSRSLLKRFFICTTWWIACTFVGIGLTVNSVLLEGNKYVNFALSCVVEVPSNFIVGYILNKFNRKAPLIWCFMICAVLCGVQPFISNNLLWLTISLYMIGKLMSTMYFAITYIYTSELFPTHTRNSMHALCSSVGRIGAITAPQTSLLMVYWTGLPTLLFAVVSLLAGLATFFVPDTSEKALPDTVRQAEAIDSTDTVLDKDHCASRKNNDCTCL